jgi:hypothetical protein
VKLQFKCSVFVFAEVVMTIRTGESGLHAGDIIFAPHCLSSRGKVLASAALPAILASALIIGDAQLNLNWAGLCDLFVRSNQRDFSIAGFDETGSDDSRARASHFIFGTLLISRIF